METETRQAAETEINLIDYLITLLKWKRLIIGTTLTCVVITAIIGLFIPKTYRAETRILPPQQASTSMASQLLNQVGGGLTGLGGMLGANSQTDLYTGMLQSRTILDAIITRFDLKTLYHDKLLEDARKKLRQKVTVQSDPKNNLIVIAAEDKDPERAADMANAFVEELRRMTKELAVTEASQRRLFFEEQLKDTKESMTRAEEAVKGFQEKTGAIHVEEQVKAVIKSIAQLRAEIAAKEVEIKVLKTYSKSTNPDLQKAETGLSGMKAELAKLESKSGSGNDPMMPTGRMPAVATEYTRKLKDLRFNEALYELFLKQYEMAKLDEARNAAIIQVIDRAVPPEKKIKPKIASMMLVASIASFMFSLLLVVVLEKKEQVCRQPENKDRMEKLKKYAGIV